jgi:hypothetical protein
MLRDLMRVHMSAGAVDSSTTGRMAKYMMTMKALQGEIRGA